MPSNFQPGHRSINSGNVSRDKTAYNLMKTVDTSSNPTINKDDKTYATCDRTSTISHALARSGVFSPPPASTPGQFSAKRRMTKTLGQNKYPFSMGGTIPASCLMSMKSQNVLSQRNDRNAQTQHCFHKGNSSIGVPSEAKIQQYK
jgi:hypothetical protein